MCVQKWTIYILFALNEKNPFFTYQKNMRRRVFSQRRRKIIYLSFFLTQPVSISSRKTVAMTVSRMMPTRGQRHA